MNKVGDRTKAPMNFKTLRIQGPGLRVVVDPGNELEFAARERNVDDVQVGHWKGDSYEGQW